MTAKTKVASGPACRAKAVSIPSGSVVATHLFGLVEDDYAKNVLSTARFFGTATEYPDGTEMTPDEAVTELLNQLTLAEAKRVYCRKAVTMLLTANILR